MNWQISLLFYISCVHTFGLERSLKYILFNLHKATRALVYFQNTIKNLDDRKLEIIALSESKSVSSGLKTKTVQTHKSLWVDKPIQPNH